MVPEPVRLPLAAGPRRRSARVLVAYVLATWFGCGRFPGMPGTVGTLGALPVYFLVRGGGTPAVLAAAVVATVTGIWAASVVCVEESKKDPQHVVIDEVAGVLVALAAAPPTWRGVTAAVVAFRVFDQFKPWPARAAERRLPGGYGVVLDDVAAGVWGAAVVWGLGRLGVLAS